MSDYDWADAVELCGEILDMCDELPERADDFREGVEERVRDMCAWIEDNRRVTEKQTNALENIKRGVEKWLNG